MAKKKQSSKLPFVVAPRLKPIEEILGTEDTGQIKIKRQGYLSVGERAFMSNAEAGDESTRTVLGLCKKVALDLELDLNNAYQAVMAAATGNGVDEYGLNEKYSEEIRDLLSALISSESRRNYMKCLCLLVYRIDSEIGIEDIADMHPDLIQAIVELYDDEEQKSIERLAESSVSDEQDAEVVDELSKK